MPRKSGKSGNKQILGDGGTIKGVIQFSYQGTVDGEVVGKTIQLAAPLGELSQPLEAYFPNGDPWRWFEEMSARERREWIIGGLMHGACPIFGYPSADERVEVHHEYRKGMGGRIEAEAPWAMIPGLKSPDFRRSAHDLYHQKSIEDKGFTLVHWDPLDVEDGLEVLDEAGEPIDRADLWFYTRPTTDRVSEALKWKEAVRDMAATQVRATYQLGQLAAIGLDYAKLLGYQTVASFFASEGIGNDAPQMTRLLREERPEEFDELTDKCVIVDAADLWRKRTSGQEPDVIVEWYDLLLKMCSIHSEQPSFGAFASLLRRRFATNTRERAVVIVTGGDFNLQETTAEDPEGLAAAGQTVILGHRVVPKEPAAPSNGTQPLDLDAKETGE